MSAVGAGAPRSISSVERMVNLMSHAIRLIERQQGAPTRDRDQFRARKYVAQPTREVDFKEPVRSAPEQQYRFGEKIEAGGDIEQFRRPNGVQEARGVAAHPGIRDRRADPPKSHFRIEVFADERAIAERRMSRPDRTHHPHHEAEPPRPPSRL